MNRISRNLFVLLALVGAANILGMEPLDEHRDFRIIPAAQARLMINQTLNGVATFIPTMTPVQRQAAVNEAITQLNQSTEQNVVALPRLREIMRNIAQQKNINAEVMNTAFDLVLVTAEGKKASQTAPKKAAQNDQKTAATRFHRLYGTLILLDRELAHLPVLQLMTNQQGQDRTCGPRAVANARAIDILCDANRPVCSEMVRKEAQTVFNTFAQNNTDNLASDEIRNLANQANIHNFYILHAQADKGDRNYQIVFGDTNNDDPENTAANLEIDLQNIHIQPSGAIHFFCNLAAKKANGSYKDGHWIVISLVKEEGRELVVIVQDSSNKKLQKNTLAHLYLFEVFALCKKHAGLFGNLAFDITKPTVIDRSRGIKDQDDINNNNNAPRDTNTDCVIC